MIKDEIRHTQNELSRLKEQYKRLVVDIKETFYDKDYWVKDSPRKPRNEAAKMQAALCIAQDKCPRLSMDLKVMQARSWSEDGPYVWYDYWTINQKKFKAHDGTPATIIVRKRDIKLLVEICKGLWIKEVGASYRPNTILGFEEWLDATEIDKIYELMCEHLNEVKNTRVHLVTDRNLYLKDFVVIFPKRKYSLHHDL